METQDTERQLRAIIPAAPEGVPTKLEFRDPRAATGVKREPQGFGIDLMRMNDRWMAFLANGFSYPRGTNQVGYNRRP